ncbi:flagellin N-terminal helical domain-containing protein [Iodobacter fluviatilis]|uniref:Flagellin n=1 Tax=Iodobacter fluviatilis TaxID=537 RepID=A0A377SW57_9NEIS|nr:flagellin [Iodobacter fluviatilis]TCU86145.1 flagellin [Iodobacter fluviatilis]STR44556.1 Flagellin [Iodobacter fluviatilis]
MLSLHTNAAALSTQRNLGTSQSALTTSMTRLGTGLRINSAMDDAAGLQIATRMDAQSRGMQAAMKNTQNGISMLQTAEGALGEVSSILLRMKDLATEGANGTASADDKTAMQSEFDALGKEMGNIMKNTSFGGEALLDKTAGKLGSATVDFQIGASAAEKMTVDLKTGLTALDTALGGASAAYTTPGTAGTELTSAGGANAQITKLEAALKAVGTVRSDMGANANRLDHVYNNLGNMDSNTKMAKGRIMDTDYATEQAKMTSNQMLMQAGTSMLKQSGSMSQMVMSLMQ